MVKHYHILRTVPLFDMISRDELEQLLHCLHGKFREYAKDQTLISAGDPVSTIGIVLEGTVQVLREDADGRQLIIAELGQGELFAESFVCAELSHSPVSVRAAANCLVLTMNYRRIVTVCPAACMFHARLIGNMLSLISHKNILLNSRIEILSRRTTREKVLFYLERQAERKNARAFTIPFSRQELADFLCVERSALSRELSRMQDEGLIRFEKNRFELLGGARVETL